LVFEADYLLILAHYSGNFQRTPISIQTWIFLFDERQKWAYYMGRI